MNSQSLMPVMPMIMSASRLSCFFKTLMRVKKFNSIPSRLLFSPVKHATIQSRYLCTSTVLHDRDRVKLVAKNAPVRGFDGERNVTDRLRNDVLLTESYRDTVLFSRKLWLPQSAETTQLIGRLVSEDDRSDNLARLCGLDPAGFTDLLLAVLSSGRLAASQRSALLQLLESAACARLPTATLPHALRVADMFYVSACDARRYYAALLRAAHLRWRHLAPTPANVVQLLFSVATLRRAPVELMRCAEAELSSSAARDVLTARDFTLMCHAFFASNTALHSVALLQGVAAAVLRDLPRTPPRLLVNVLKAFRHAAFAPPPFYAELGRRVSLRRESVAVVAHFVDAFAGVRLAHDELFTEVALHLVSPRSADRAPRSTDSVPRSTNSARRSDDRASRPAAHVSCSVDSAPPSVAFDARRTRMKDVGRLLWAYATLGHALPAGCVDAAVALLRDNTPHWTRYPEAFIECLVAMVMSGVYPADMLHFALSADFLKLKAGGCRPVAH